MVKHTVNLVLAAINDSGNGFSKTYIQYEDGTNNTTITPSLYSPITSQDSIQISELENLDLEELNNNMDAIVKSPALKSKSEILVGNAAIASGNYVTDYNVEANTGKADPDITIIIPLVKIAYAALTHSLIKDKSIPSTINVNIICYLTCLPIREYGNIKKRELLKKKLCKGKHTIIIKNFEQDIKVIVSFNPENTFIYPEGIVGQYGLIYDPKNYPNYRNDSLYKESPYKDGQEYCTSGNTLLIDIGDGTTDISIMSGTHPRKGLGVNTSLNQGVGTAAAIASDKLAIDYPQVGHYTRSTFLERASKNDSEGKTLRDKYLSPQIDLLVKVIASEVEKEYRRMNNDISTIVVLGGGVNLLSNKNKTDFQTMVDDLNPFKKHQKVWWINSEYNQLLNLDGLHVFLNSKFKKNN